jgi:hypothetical protein
MIVRTTTSTTYQTIGDLTHGLALCNLFEVVSTSDGKQIFVLLRAISLVKGIKLVMQLKHGYLWMIQYGWLALIATSFITYRLRLRYRYLL